MFRPKSLFFRKLSVLLAAVFFFSSLYTLPPSSYAMTIQEERELGEKVLQEVRKIWPMVQDPAPREYIARVGK
jgi:predicted Zn-dependent protease